MYKVEVTSIGGLHYAVVAVWENEYAKIKECAKETGIIIPEFYNSFSQIVKNYKSKEHYLRSKVMGEMQDFVIVDGPKLVLKGDCERDFYDKPINEAYKALILTLYRFVIAYAKLPPSELIKVRSVFLSNYCEVYGPVEPIEDDLYRWMATVQYIAFLISDSTPQLIQTLLELGAMSATQKQVNASDEVALVDKADTTEAVFETVQAPNLRILDVTVACKASNIKALTFSIIGSKTLIKK